MTISVFDSTNKLLWVKGRIPRSLNESQRFFGLPSGVSIFKNKTICVVDAFNFSLKVFNKSGDYLGEFGERGVGDGEFNFARGLRIFKSTLGVVDMENNRIQIYSIDSSKLNSLKPNWE